MKTFHAERGSALTLIDRRAGIGPHHLAIGKTRKIVSIGAHHYAVFSTGFGLALAVVSAATGAVVGRQELPMAATAWGGAAFCVASHGDTIDILYVHRDRYTLAAVSGVAEGASVVWSAPVPVLVSASPLAAPWLEASEAGLLWGSVLARDLAIRTLVSEDGRHWREGRLFNSGEARWHHSAVQIVPVGTDRAMAIGFRGEFPTRTELVAKEISLSLAAGESETVAPCNVNDQLTFHFQAVGDAARSSAHVVYLDEGLSVSHAAYRAGRWTVEKGVFAEPAFAPQVTRDHAGNLALLVCDYDGEIWTAGHSAGNWGTPRRLTDAPLVSVSAAFGRTQYGTGGLISAPTALGSDVAFLAARIEDDRDGTASLWFGRAGSRDGLRIDAGRRLEARQNGRMLIVELPLVGLTATELATDGNVWLVKIPEDGGGTLALLVRGTRNGPRTELLRITTFSGATIERLATARLAPIFTDPCWPSEAPAGLTLSAELPANARPIVAACRAETFANAPPDGLPLADLVDLAPFHEDINAAAADRPARIPQLFKRIV